MLLKPDEENFSKELSRGKAEAKEMNKVIFKQ